MNYVFVRRSVLLCLAAVPGIALAIQSPPGCFLNDLNASIALPPGSTIVDCGSSVDFTNEVNNGLNAGACDITDLPVEFTCPDPATGMASGPTTLLDAGSDFPAVPPSSTTYPAVSCVIGQVTNGSCTCGSQVYQGLLHAGPGTLNINPDSDLDFAEIFKTVSVQCREAPPEGRHYQCYETKRRSFPGIPVTLQDVFGTSNTTALRPERLCAPANKNGEDPDAPEDPAHLAGYMIKRPFSTVFGQEVSNQFGTVTLDVRRVDWLLVPSSKGLTDPPDPLPPDSTRHYQCYRVSRSRGTPRFDRHEITMEDQFESTSLTLQNPNRLCVPVNKNGEDPSAVTDPNVLLCYAIRRSPFKGPTVFIENQFGAPDQVDIIQRVEFCVPSVLNAPPSPSGAFLTPAP